MNSRQAAEIALGVAGVWLIASRTLQAGFSLVVGLTQPWGALSWAPIAYVGLALLCGLGLVMLRHRIAAWLVPTPQPIPGGVATDAQAIAFSVLAVYLVAHGLSGVAGGLPLLRSYVVSGPIERLAAPLAEIIVGVALFVGSRRLAATWESLRTVGLRGGEPRDAGA